MAERVACWRWPFAEAVDVPVGDGGDGLAEEAVVEAEAADQVVPLRAEEVPHDRFSDPVQQSSQKLRSRWLQVKLS